MDVNDALRAALSGGIRNSREVLAELGALGFSAKQIRRARERLGVLTKRQGRRADMRSMWALPMPQLAPEVVSETSPARARDAEPIPPAYLRKHKASDSGEMLAFAKGLSEAEATRVARRAAAFIARGLTAALANDVAIALVLERDRGGTREGSCIECQCMVHGGCTSAEFSGGSRDVREIWYCGYARRDTP